MERGIYVQKKVKHLQRKNNARPKQPVPVRKLSAVAASDSGCFDQSAQAAEP